MKKFFCVLLAGLLLTVPLCGCAANETADGRTVVHFLNWGDYIDPTVIPLFEEENPDIKINITTNLQFHGTGRPTIPPIRIMSILARATMSGSARPLSAK